MFRLLMISLMCLALTTVVGVQIATAEGDYVTAWKAAYPDVCVELTTAANNCSLCHNTPGFGNRNSYGEDYAANGYVFDATLGNMDSDGDSRTNDEEILIDCTEPGNEFSTGDNEQTWAFIKSIYDTK